MHCVLELKFLKNYTFSTSCFFATPIYENCFSHLVSNLAVKDANLCLDIFLIAPVRS